MPACAIHRLVPTAPRAGGPCHAFPAPILPPPHLSPSQTHVGGPTSTLLVSPEASLVCSVAPGAEWVLGGLLSPLGNMQGLTSLSAIRAPGCGDSTRSSGGAEETLSDLAESGGELEAGARFLPHPLSNLQGSPLSPG